MSTYAEKLRKPAWQKRRLKVMERDNWTCQLCKSTERTLNVHHLKYTGEPHEAPDEDLITYCELCHSLVEKLKPSVVTKIETFRIAEGYGFVAKVPEGIYLGHMYTTELVIDVSIGNERIPIVIDAIKKVTA